MKLTDKTIIVTGGASGISRATARLIGQAGGRVIIGDLNADGGNEAVQEIRKAGGRADYITLDLTSHDSIDAFAAAAIELGGGRIDGLVNGAGWDRVEPFLKNAPEMWERVIDINLMGAVRLTQTIAKAMVQVSSGKIVNVASDAGRVGSSGETVYAAAKGGLIAFTKSLARETARYKLNVNCVCPGPTDTPLFHAQPDERIKEALIKAIPFRRLGRPEEVGQAIVFFLSAHSDYVTGQVLSVSGGLTMVD
ncbi:MAG: SDR family oxidoreductase [Burkholderiaceae bacterium]|nr:SDR family oxidoreductase [Burkholderiaceae bacterium]